MSYLLDYAALPFLSGPIGDSTVYLAQADAVRGGRFGDPTLLAFSPLYGYVLASFPNPAMAVLLQTGVSVVNIWLIYWTLQGVFGWRAALISGALYLGYGMVSFYETKLLSDSLGLTLALWAMLAFLSHGFRDGRWSSSLGTGALVGVAVLVRGSLVFAVPLFALVSLFPWRATEKLGSRLKRATGIVAGVSLIFLIYGLWTQVHAGTFVLVRYITPSTSNLENTTSQGWNDDLAAFGFRGSDAIPSAWDVVDAVERDLERRSVSSEGPEPGAIQALSAIDVRGWLAGAPRKLRMAFSDTERSFQYGYYAERNDLPSLRMLPITFHVLLCLGFIGALFLGRRHGFSSLWPYTPWFLGAILTVTLYHPSSRYRFGMVVPLVLLAGFSAEQLFVRARERRVRYAIAFVAMFARFPSIAL